MAQQLLHRSQKGDVKETRHVGTREEQVLAHVEVAHVLAFTVAGRSTDGSRLQAADVQRHGISPNRFTYLAVNEGRKSSALINIPKASSFTRAPLLHT